MDVLNVLLPLAGCVFTCGKVAVHDGEVGGVNLQEECDGPFVAEVVLEAGLDLLPLVHVDPVVECAADEDQGGNADHIIAAEVDIGLVAVGSRLAQVGLDHLAPVLDDLVVAADEHVEGVQLHHLLQADHQDVRLVHREVEQLLLVLLRQLLGVDRVAVPGEDEQHGLLVGAVLDLFQHVLGDVVVEVLGLGEFFLLSEEEVYAGLLEAVVDVGVVVAVDGLHAAREEGEEGVVLLLDEVRGDALRAAVDHADPVAQLRPHLVQRRQVILVEVQLLLLHVGVRICDSGRGTDVAHDLFEEESADPGHDDVGAIDAVQAVDPRYSKYPYPYIACCL